MSEKTPTIRSQRAALASQDDSRREAVVQELEAIAAGEATDVIQWDDMGRVTLTPRLMRMLEALPGSVVAALILPVIVKEGLSAALAMTAVALVMIWRRNEFLALALGLGVVIAMRAAGW